MFAYNLVCAECGEITGQIGLPTEPTREQIDSYREGTCDNGHRAIGVMVGEGLRMPSPLPPAPEPVAPDPILGELLDHDTLVALLRERGIV